MADFARIDKNNIVQAIQVVHNDCLLNEHGVEEEDFGINFLNKLHGFGFTWVQTSTDGSFRKNRAGEGYTYDKGRDAFILPKPHASWTLNEDTCHWEPPVPIPNTRCNWNEDTQAWDEGITTE